MYAAYADIAGDVMSHSRIVAGQHHNFPNFASPECTHNFSALCSQLIFIDQLSDQLAFNCDHERRQAVIVRLTAIVPGTFGIHGDFPQKALAANVHTMSIDLGFDASSDALPEPASRRNSDLRFAGLYHRGKCYWMLQPLFSSGGEF